LRDDPPVYAFSISRIKTTRYLENMRTIACTFVALLFASAPLAFGALPQLTVTVADSTGKAAYKGTTNAKGTFATGALKPGKYVVQFNGSGIKGGNYALVVSAGTKKVTADAVAGEKFGGGGVAMKIDVGSGLNITGQVTTGLQTKVDPSGKKMVWIPKKLGSNLPAHWAAEDSAEAKEARSQGTLSTKSVQDIQAHQDQHAGN
jgi:hypothetical protein